MQYFLIYPLLKDYIVERWFSTRLFTIITRLRIIVEWYIEEKTTMEEVGRAPLPMPLIYPLQLCLHLCLCIGICGKFSSENRTL